jgi:hypothetical protein
MTNELLKAVMVAGLLGGAGCVGIDKDGEPIEFEESADEVPKKMGDRQMGDEEESDETPDEEPDEMVNNAEELPDEEPVEVDRPRIECTDNVIAEDPYPQQLPGWDRFEFEVEVTEGVGSFSLIGVNQRENGAAVESFTTPDGDTIDAFTDPMYSRYLQAAFYTTEGSIMPLVVPATPERADLVQPGTYTVTGLSQDAEFCWYLVENHAEAKTLKVNFFFVDMEDVDADNAAEHPDWKEVVETVANTFAAAGIGLEPNYVPIPADVAAAHADPRSIANLDMAVRDVVDAADEPLPMRSIDVFLWEEFEGEAAQMHGMARGIPDATGLHGERGNGVVLQTLGLLGFEGIHGGREVVGNLELGLTISHEIGHLLGLFHTSEFYNGDHDLAADTPECENASSLQEECPDASNLMFPLGPLYMSQELSDDQVAMLLAHPSVAR